MAKVYGYCRCSTNEKKQDINRQIRELKELGATDKTIYKEYIKGTANVKVELNKLLAVIKEGDTLVATEVSRITRSTKQLCEIIELAKNKKIKLIFGTFVVDCTKELDPMTEGMLKMMGVFAELERNMISERVKSGLANAKANNKRVGRPELTEQHVKENTKFMDCYKLWKEGRINKVQIRQLTSLSRTTIDKYIQALEG